MAYKDALYQATFEVFNPETRQMEIGSVMTRQVLIDDETGRVIEWGSADFEGIAVDETEWEQWRDERFLVFGRYGEEAHEASYADFDQCGDKSVGAMVDKNYSDSLFQLQYIM